MLWPIYSFFSFHTATWVAPNQLTLIDADWCWLMMIDADWFWLVLIDANWFWLVLIDSDWCWLTLINAYWCWLVLIDSDWFWLMLIDADCSCLMLIGAVIVVVINADQCWLILIVSYWCWMMLFYWSISPEFSRSIFKWPLSCSLSIPQPGMSLHLPHLIPRKLFLNVKGEFWCSVRKVNGGQWRQVGMFPVNWNTLFSWADKSRIIYICSQSNIIQYYYGQISFFFSTLLKTKPTKQNILIYWAIFGPRLTKGALLRKPIPQKKLERYCKNCECCHS